MLDLQERDGLAVEQAAALKVLLRPLTQPPLVRVESKSQSKRRMQRSKTITYGKCDCDFDLDSGVAHIYEEADPRKFPVV